MAYCLLPPLLLTFWNIGYNYNLQSNVPSFPSRFKTMLFTINLFVILIDFWILLSLLRVSMGVIRWQYNYRFLVNQDKLCLIDFPIHHRTILVLSVYLSIYCYWLYIQRSKGIRQWLINGCRSPMMIIKLPIL